MKKESINRLYGLDLLKILSMVLITVIHFIDWANILEMRDISLVNKAIFSFCYALTTVSVNSFVMITGYFQTDKSVNFKRVFSLWINVIIVAVLLLLGMVLLRQPVGKMNVIKTVFPMLTVNYWFLSSYIVLCIASPFLNILIKNMDKHKHSLLCIVGFLLICVYYTTNPFITEMIYVGHPRGILWFCYLYFVAAYIKKYDINIKKGMLINLIIILIFIMSVITMFDARKIGNINLLGNYAILPFLCSVLVFLLFKSFTISGTWLKNTIVELAECSFYVYIIQEHDVVRSWYWSLFTAFENGQDFKIIVAFLSSLVVLWPAAFIINKILKLFKPMVDKMYLMGEKMIIKIFKL